MADNERLARQDGEATGQQTSRSTPAPSSMLDGARAALGGPLLARKLARRVARKAEAGAALNAFAESFQGSAAAASQIAGDAPSPRAQSPAEVANAGFADAGHEVPHRKEMEESFGADFSGVRAYTGASAAEANRALSSHAYAMGDQMAFRDASPSRSTVAHELTHVLQQTHSPSYKSSDAGGIDTAGEHEAEAVEAAVSSGRPASSVLTASRPSLGGGAALKKAGPALKARRPALEGGPDFGMGMTFSLEGFEKSYDYTLWKGHYAWPIGVPGVNFVVDPNVKVSAKSKVDWGGKDKGTTQTQLGVFGEVGLGLSGGIPDLAEVYGTFNPGIEGAFTLVKEAPDASGGAHESKGGHESKEHGGAWHLAGAISVKGAAKVGVSLGGGIVDQAFELGSIDICTLTGIYFDNSGFRRDKMGFEWGEKIRATWAAIGRALDKAKKMGLAAIEAAKHAGGAILRKASDLGSWVVSWGI